MIRVRLWHKACVKRHLIRLSKQTDDVALKVQIAEAIEDAVILDGLTEAIVEKQHEDNSDLSAMQFGDGELIKLFIEFLNSPAGQALIKLLLQLLLSGV